MLPRTFTISPSASRRSGPSDSANDISLARGTFLQGFAVRYDCSCWYCPRIRAAGYAVQPELGRRRPASPRTISQGVI